MTLMRSEATVWSVRRFGMICVFQLMSTQFEVRYKVSAPGSVLAAEYNASNEEVVVVGTGYCAVRLIYRSCLVSAEFIVNCAIISWFQKYVCMEFSSASKDETVL